jgi:predicted short-subunit dehydrogenase-like oxidoreductase (DUF2520 family)
MPPKTKARTPAIALIGSGNLAQALGAALRSAGYRITMVAGRNTAASQKRAAALARKLGASAVRLEDAGPQADIVWLCHTDDALARTASRLARKPGWKNKIIFHSSGALTSDVLAPLQRAGAHTASLHPMMTFVPGTTPKMKDVPFAVEGGRQAVKVAREIAARLGARVFTIKKSNKVLYHALGSFSSPMIVATLVTAEHVGQAAGLRREQTRAIIGPILEQTLDNYRKRGAAAAYSGPIKRGDLETVRRHLRELKRVPAAREVYRALVRSALPDLPAKNKRGLSRLLQP